MIEDSRFNIPPRKTTNICCCPFHVNFFLIKTEKNSFANSGVTFYVP